MLPTAAKTPSCLVIAAAAVLGAACHGHDEGTPLPSSVPVAPITGAAVLVVNGGDSSLSVIDAATNTVTATITLENAPFPHHIYLSPDGTEALVAVPGLDLSGGHGGHKAPRGGVRHGGNGDGHEGGAILRLDARTGATLAAVVLPAMNHNATFSPDGSEVWTTQAGDPGLVLVLDPVTLATLHEITVGADPSEVTFTPDGSHAFAANSASDSVSIIDVATRTVVHTVSVGDNPVGAWPGRDGIMYVDDEAGKTVTAIDATTHELVRTYDLGFTPAMALVAPSGELWVTDTDAGQLVFFSTDDGTRQGELALGAGAHAIAFSPDDATAYVSNQAAGTVSVVDVATKQVTATVTVGAAPNGIVFLPAP